MILLDTNVLSEAMKPEPAPAVRDWLDAQAAETLYLSSVSVAELLFGIGALPEGRRGQGLATVFEGVFEGVLDLFGNRVLPFDEKAARHYAGLAAAARAAGRGFSVPDGYIAAIAAAHGFIVATRDAGAFEAAGISVIDPWRAGR